jgi:hypothetical protein
MAKSSINFQQMQSGAMAHNDRSLEDPSYLLPIEFRKENEINRSSAEAKTFVKELFSEASINYRKHFKQKIQSKSYMWEAVVNLNAHHKMEDLELLVQELERETGFTGVQISIHRDEGHIEKDKSGKEFAIRNYHAHITFFTLDRSTGQQLYRRRITKKQLKTQPNLKPFDRKRLNHIQTLVSKSLNMERGEEGSSATRLSSKEYRAVQKQIKKEKEILVKNINNHFLPKLKDLKKENAQLRLELQEQGANREDYAKLEQTMRDLKTEIKNKTLTIDKMNIELDIFRNRNKKETDLDIENKKNKTQLEKALYLLDYFNPELEINYDRLDDCYDYYSKKQKQNKTTNKKRIS